MAGELTARKQVIVRAVLDIESGAWESVVREDYDGPWELADRAAQREAKDLQQTAATSTQDAQQQAGVERGILQPFYRQEMQAQHAFTPGQLNELLNFAGQGAAGAASTGAGQIASNAARTRNTAGVTSALQQNARDRGQALAQANLGVGAQDVLGAKELNQAGAAGEAGLFGTDTNAALQAMGLRNQAIDTQIQAGKGGWFQNLMQGLNTASNLFGPVKSMLSRSQGGGNNG